MIVVARAVPCNSFPRCSGFYALDYWVEPESLFRLGISWTGLISVNEGIPGAESSNPTSYRGCESFETNFDFYSGGTGVEASILSTFERFGLILQAFARVIVKLYQERFLLWCAGASG